LSQPAVLRGPSSKHPVEREAVGGGSTKGADEMTTNPNDEPNSSSGPCGESTEPVGPDGDPVVVSRLRTDVELLGEVTELGFEVDGEAVAVEGQWWVIYGHSAYDGEVILAEYDEPEEAQAVLRAVPSRPPLAR
jgi:hypothetical protein